MVVNILESLLLVSIVFTIGFFYGYKSKLISMYPPETPPVDCSNELNGLVQYYNENGIGEMTIRYANVYDDYKSAEFYIFGITSIPDANKAVSIVNEYMETNEKSLLNNSYIFNFEIYNKNPTDSWDGVFAPIVINYDVSGIYTISTVDIFMKNCIANSLSIESFPINVEKVNVYQLAHPNEELTEEELECIEQNYPDAEIVF